MRAARTTRRLAARVSLGPVEAAGKTFDLTWIAASDGTDTVTVDVRGLQPSRVGTVVDPGGTPRLELAEDMYTYLRDRHSDEILAAVQAAFAVRHRR